MIFLDYEIILKIFLLLFGAVASPLFIQWFERKTKLIAYIGQTGIFKLKKRGNVPETEIATHSLVVRNNGKKSAKNVKVVHVKLPDDFVVFPSIDWKIKELEYGAKTLHFPNLAPGQQITISYLYPPGSCVHGEISHDDGMAKIIQVLPARQFPKPVYMIYNFFAIAGLITILYLVGSLFAWLLFTS